MLEKRERAPSTRMVEDKQLNNGTPKFLVNAYKQLYIAMQWKNDNGAPTAYCKLCNKEAWSPTHIYCNQHLGHLLERPYSWTEEWHDPPSLEETGIQDPRVNGITFASLVEDFTKIGLCKHTCHPFGKEGLNVPQFVSRTAEASPPCPPEDTQMPQQSRQPQQSLGGQDMDQNLVEYLKRLHEKFNQLKMRVATLEQQQVGHAEKEQKIQEKFQD